MITKQDLILPCTLLEIQSTFSHLFGLVGYSRETEESASHSMALALHLSVESQKWICRGCLQTIFLSEFRILDSIDFYRESVRFLLRPKMG